jgi:adenylosuccinate synthase
MIVGGQYGSEGKGKVTALTAARLDKPWVVRCGGPNSGHTTCVNGKEVILRQLPAAAGHSNAILLLSAGCAISENILLKEVEDYCLPADRIVVDPRAVLVTPEDVEDEQELVGTIGSTASGTGAALSRRMLRRSGTLLAGDSAKLRGHVRVESVAPLLHNCLDRGGHIIVEGTQGFGLSLLHGPHYPHVTARDTTAAGFATETGLSPLQITEITLVLRTFPIRVGGNSGPLFGEISWQEVQKISDSPKAWPELTSVTKRERRVGQFDIELVTQACRYNHPTSLAVMGMDRLAYANYGKTVYDELTSGTRDFLLLLWKTLGIPFNWLGTGFGTFEAINCNETPVQYQ